MLEPMMEPRGGILLWNTVCGTSWWNTGLEHLGETPLGVQVVDTPCRNTLMEHSFGTPWWNTPLEHPFEKHFRNITMEHIIGTQWWTLGGNTALRHWLWLTKVWPGLFCCVGSLFGSCRRVWLYVGLCCLMGVGSFFSCAHAI